MANKKQPFSWILRRDAIAAADSFLSYIVPSGYLYCVQRVAFEDETTLVTDVRFYVSTPGRDFVIAEKDTLAADTLYVYDEPFYMVEGARLKVAVTGATGGDKLVAYVAGWYQQQPIEL